MRSPLTDALRVSWATVSWSLVSGTVSLAVGLTGGSLALGGLGAGVLVDVVSSVVLIRRFRSELRLAGVPVDAERRAGYVAAGGLVLIGVVLLATGAQRLVAGSSSDVSLLELGLAALNLVVLPLLARWKYAVADAVASLALRTDAHITLVGAATSGLTLVGLVVDRALGAGWADTAAGLAIGAVALAQGRRSLAAIRSGQA